MYHGLAFFVIVSFFYNAHGHSWLYCVDYSRTAPLTVGSINGAQCAAWPRGVAQNNVFGQDIGLDFIPGGGPACKTPFAGTTVNYKAGTTYRLVWPAKNHQADKCTNPFIPDNALKVFMFPASHTSPDPPLSTWSQQKYLVKDFKNGGKGFQSCPDFCTNMDKAPCFGDMAIPNLANGQYKALWMWEFNPGQIYTHCFDVIIGGGSGAPAPAPTPAPGPGVPPPAITPSPTPAPGPGVPPPAANCAIEAQSCTRKSCCAGLKCTKRKCVASAPGAPPTPAPAPGTPSPSKCGQPGAACNGSNPPCCAGQCNRIKDQIYQCQ